MRETNGNIAYRYLQFYREGSRETAKLSKNKRKKKEQLNITI